MVVETAEMPEGSAVAGFESTRLTFTFPTPLAVRPISSAARLEKSRFLPRT